MTKPETASPILELPVADIRLSGHRHLDDAAVKRMCASIRDVGLWHPIVVYPDPTGEFGPSETHYCVAAGDHRLEACRKLGYTVIPARVIDAADSRMARLVQIDENLCRAELSPAERAKELAERREIWKAMHPGSTAPAVGDGEPEVQPTSGPAGPDHGEDGRFVSGNTANPQGFAGDTAEVSGLSKRTINADMARAEALGPDLGRVAGTSLDKGVELDALAKLPPEERHDLVERAAAGEKVSARPRRKPAEFHSADEGKDDGAGAHGFTPLSMPKGPISTAEAEALFAALDACVAKYDEEVFVSTVAALPLGNDQRRFAKLVVKHAGKPRKGGGSPKGDDAGEGGEGAGASWPEHW